MYLSQRTCTAAPAVGQAASWRPRVDVLDGPGDYKLFFDLPGLDAKEVEVKVAENVLTVNGERKRPGSNGEAGYAVRERRFGAFSRSFRLPEAVDSEGITARFDRGTLEVRVPKVDRSRKIPIQ